MSTLQEPLVAAIILNYNYDDFLLECLVSIDSQEYKNLVVIVVDDGSTDGSRETLKKWAASARHRCVIITKEENAGPANSFNVALAHAPEDTAFFAFSDSDDIWLPGRIALQLGRIQELGDGCAVVYSDVVTFDGEFDNGGRGGATSSAHPITDHAGDSIVNMESLLSRGSGLAFNSALVRGAAMREIGSLDETMRIVDYQVWLRLARTGSFEYLGGSPVAAVRKHGRSMSRTEPNFGDRLRLLGRSPRTATERRCARRRGRSLLRVAIMSDFGTPHTIYWEYSIGARDIAGIFAWCWGSSTITRKLTRRLYDSSKKA